MFGKDSGWLEVQWFRRRMHDEAVDDRRTVRIFVKPLTPPHNTQKFLNRFRRQDEDHTAYLQGVALVTQLLVIDSLGKLEPTGITTEASGNSTMSMERYFPGRRFRYLRSAERKS